MTRVLGIDISRNFAVGFLLSECPKNPREWFDSFPAKTFRRKKKQYRYSSRSVLLTNDRAGVDLFRSLKPDIIILEPTGYHYSHYWVLQAERLGCRVLWMAHQSLARHRSHYGFKNKNDDVDAFVLALTYFDEMLPRRRYMTNYNDKLITQLRLAYYERKRLLKGINQNTNQISQFLEIEHPEIATRKLTTINKEGLNPCLGHIAGVYKNRQYPKENTGLGLSRRTISLAVETMQKQTSVSELDIIMAEIMSAREFTPYLEVFRDYGFTSIAAPLLLKCYPIERFLDAGKVIRDKRGNNISLRQFQAYLGLGYTYEKSGDTSHQSGRVKKSWQGSKLCRSDLYAWLLSNPCKVNRFVPKTDTQRRLKDLWVEDRERNGEKLPSYRSLGRDGICRMEFTVTRWLFRDLLRAIDRLEF
jgi:hypothetical protein